MYKALGRPLLMLIDLCPISLPLVVIRSYEIAEQIVKASSGFPYRPPKSPETWRHLEHLTGPTSIVSSRIYGPNSEHCAQTDNPTYLMRVFHELIQAYADEQVQLPWWYTPRVEWKRHNLAKRARGTLKSIVRERYAELGQAAKSRSILSMSLHGIEELNAKTVDVTCDHLSTFLFAGHDTTSITLAWAFYELSHTSHALRAVRAELNELFGPEAASVGIGAAWPGEATGQQPEVGEHSQYKVEKEMYMKMQVTAKPVDGMMMKLMLCAHHGRRIHGMELRRCQPLVDRGYNLQSGVYWVQNLILSQDEGCEGFTFPDPPTITLRCPPFQPDTVDDVPFSYDTVNDWSMEKTQW
ncbi:Uu.00g142370.m01.CDS01 [Anthostomella pinea]|uniref:Uu.00g142370.m01.CDS01 n=1 Tax=Anthostomella pinea TaxID=933095 RepID=A0AAI8YJ62_9PEZI|nr:Uu.00g142370.m01.CDS01 [Anthostomella pinea]